MNSIFDMVNGSKGSNATSPSLNAGQLSSLMSRVTPSQAKSQAMQMAKQRGMTDAELRGMYENLARQEGDHLSALAAQAERLLWADGTITTECRDFLIELLAQHKQKAKALKEQLR